MGNTNVYSSSASLNTLIAIIETQQKTMLDALSDYNYSNGVKLLDIQKNLEQREQNQVSEEALMVRLSLLKKEGLITIKREDNLDDLRMAKRLYSVNVGKFSEALGIIDKKTADFLDRILNGNMQDLEDTGKLEEGLQKSFELFTESNILEKALTLLPTLPQLAKKGINVKPTLNGLKIVIGLQEFFKENS